MSFNNTDPHSPYLLGKRLSGVHCKENIILLKQMFFEWTKGMMTIGAAAVLLLGMIVLTGCPEAQDMVKPIVNEPADTTPPTMVGEVKKPGDEPADSMEEESLAPEESVEPEGPIALIPEPPEPHENDFTGQVVIPTGDQMETLGFRARTRPVAGVTLTVLSGERTGEQSVTDENGNYRFADSAREIHSLRLQTEKEGFEPKEVIVHRSKPTTTIGDGIHFSLAEKKPQEIPGTILVGHAWPDEVRFILEETVLPHDPILVRTDDLPAHDDMPEYCGLYWAGVIVVGDKNCLLSTIAHELGHAHQHAIVAIEKGPDASVYEWENTSEGIAYAQAWEKDQEEVGKELSDEGLFLTPVENMAEIAGLFWNIQRKFDTPLCFSTVNMAEKVPNRLRWAQEWLGKQYD